MKVAMICAVFLVFIAVQPLEAFECYSCSFPDCEGMNLDDPKNKIQCTRTTTCFKEVVEDVVMTKGCGQGGISKTNDCEKQSALGISGEVCVCDSSLCNSANFNKLNVAITTLFVFLSIKIFS